MRSTRAGAVLRNQARIEVLYLPEAENSFLMSIIIYPSDWTIVSTRPVSCDDAAPDPLPAMRAREMIVVPVGAPSPACGRELG
jgi:hypothetical protein